MKGYSIDQLGQIDVELKEAVCDSLVSLLVARVSGTDERGRNLYGRSPRRNIVAGQLLPRYGATGDDETSDIRIASSGVDFVVAAGSKANVRVTPRFCVYLRILPQWSDLVAGSGDLEFDFRLNSSVQEQIDIAIRANREAALKAAGIDRPDWRAMDETRRATIRAQRADILAAVRKKAYAAHDIELVQAEPHDEADTGAAKGDDAIADPNREEEVAPAPAPVSRLLREGRSMPLALVDPAPIPGKWRRLELQLPTLEFGSDDGETRLNDTVDAYNRRLAAAVAEQIEAWTTGEGAMSAWRDVRVAPADTLSEEEWSPQPE